MRAGQPGKYPENPCYIRKKHSGTAQSFTESLGPNNYHLAKKNA